jgi:hypothetical protein
MDDFKTGGYCSVCLKPTNECTCFSTFWNIVGDNREKRIFKIPIADIPEDKLEEYIKEIKEKFNKIVDVPDGDLSLPGAEPDMEMDVAYFTEKRDDLLERLVTSIKLHEPDEKIENRLKVLLRINKQLKLIEDATIIYKVTKANKPE